MDIATLPPRSEKGNVHVVVEIPRDCQNKYEYRKDLGVIALDRVLYSAVHYPTEYGFVPSTRSQDGELLDCLVMVERPTFPGCLVEVRLLGVLTITQTDGKEESKLLGVPVSDPRFDEYQALEDVPQHRLKEIENFFDVFKQLEGSDIGTKGWKGAREAEAVLERFIIKEG